jgi:hypothetical protein
MIERRLWAAPLHFDTRDQSVRLGSRETGETVFCVQIYRAAELRCAEKRDPRDMTGAFVGGLDKALTEGRLKHGATASLKQAHWAALCALGYGDIEKPPRGFAIDAFSKKPEIRAWLEAHKIYP